VVSGWGRVSPAVCRLVRLTSEAQAMELLRAPDRRGLVARGLGRSYGDAAQRAGGTVLETLGLDWVGRIDPESATVEVGAGVSLGRLLRLLLPAGLFVPVSPGTRFVTVGGAIAADIHGKNHHRDGSFATHVDSLTLATPQGLHRLAPSGEGSRLFWATAGGMGLTGVILAARLRLTRVETARMAVDTRRTDDLDGLLAAMEEADARHRYSVAWLDATARGAALGRGVLSAGDHARLDQLPPSQQRGGRALRFRPRPGLLVAPRLPASPFSPGVVRALNRAWWAASPRRESGRISALEPFFWPLDGVRGWNRLYGPGGLVQYQLVVPFGQERALRSVLEAVARGPAPCCLAVLKRFGPASPGPLSFPSPGWTLAMDFPAAAPGLAGLLDRLDDEVAEAGGRVYLAKDCRLRPELLAAMYPRIEEWRLARQEADPGGVLRSDLSERLVLAGAGQDQGQEAG